MVCLSVFIAGTGFQPPVDQVLAGTLAWEDTQYSNSVNIQVCTINRLPVGSTGG